MSKTSKCKQCGHCCIMFPTVILTDEEARSGLYEVRKKKLDGYYILKRQTKWIPELKHMKGVCIYYDPKTHRCLIHNHKPKACRRSYCGGDGLVKQWHNLIEYYRQKRQKRILRR